MCMKHMTHTCTYMYANVYDTYDTCMNEYVKHVDHSCLIRVNIHIHICMDIYDVNT